MTTIITNPAPTTDSGNSMGIIVAVLLVAVFAILFFVYGVPAMRSTDSGPNTTNSAPAVQVPQVAIPNKIDVNIQPAK